MNCSFPFKKKSESTYTKSSEEVFIGKEHNLRVFSLSELKTATDNFKDPIRRGGFGTVYKGTIRPPKGEGGPIVVAIKRFIVQQVIYRTFKPSNVFLDEYFKPKLSDSWLAKKGPFDEAKKRPTDGYDRMVTYNMEYTVPEYYITGHLTVESDIYNFGIVLYEILIGRKLWETNVPLKDIFLLSWVKRHPVDSKGFSMTIDPRPENQYSLSAASKIAKLAGACTEESLMDRPKMSEVVEILKQAIEESVEESYETSAFSKLVASSKHSTEGTLTSPLDTYS